MKNFRVTVYLNDVKAVDDDEDTLKDAVKDALRMALIDDEAGEQELDYHAEEIEEDDF